MPFFDLWGVLGDGEEGEFDGRALLTRLAREVVRRHLTVPAIVLLESAKPLSFLAGQALIFFGPMVRILLGVPHYYRFAELIEERANVEFLIEEIERFAEHGTEADEGAAVQAGEEGAAAEAAGAPASGAEAAEDARGAAREEPDGTEPPSEGLP